VKAMSETYVPIDNGVPSSGAVGPRATDSRNDDVDRTTPERKEGGVGGSIGVLATLIFLQMLPATLLTPAIRPLFALRHGGDEGAMHAFMALNMLGGFIAAPVLGAIAGRSARPLALARLLILIDAVLLATLAAPFSTPVILALRLAEGAAHIGGATILLAEAAALGRRSDDGRPMALAGAGIMFAIAVGSACGGVALQAGVSAPFVLGSCLLLFVTAASFAWPAAAADAAPARGSTESRMGLVRRHPALLVPLSAAFVERFTIGCLVVTFSLFAHNVHGLSDTNVGLLFSMLTFPFAVSMYPIGRLGERFPRAAILALGAGVYAATLGALGFIRSDMLPLAMLALGVACGMMFAPTLSFAATIAGGGRAERARAMGLVNAAGCLGMLLGPAVAGIVSSLLRSTTDSGAGYRAVFVLAGATVVVWLLASARWLVASMRNGSSRAKNRLARIA